MSKARMTPPSSVRVLYTKASRKFCYNSCAILHQPSGLLFHQIYGFYASTMPVFTYCWRGVRCIAGTLYGYFRSGVRKVIPGVIRRRLTARAQRHDATNQPVRTAKARQTFNILQKGAIKRCIYKVQANDVSFTSLKKLLKTVKRDMNFNGNSAALRKLLTESGIQPIVSTNYRKYFMENKSTIKYRGKYLENIMKYRNEGRPLIYTAVSSVKLPRIKNMLDRRVVVAYASTEYGIIHEATTVYRYDMPMDQWYNLVKYEKYEHWIRTDLVPNLPPNSVVIMRSTPWNRITMKKTAMEAWLEERNIPFDSNMPNNDLLKLIKINKEKHQHKIIDEILNRNNHTVLRLPTFSADLNPLEVMWTDIQKKVEESKTRHNIKHVTLLTLKELASIDELTMSSYYHRIRMFESGYRICGMHADALHNRILCQERAPNYNARNPDLEDRENTDEDDGSEEEEEDSDVMNE